jgi:[acyl-carrier-protein] S-malonyltransferase
VFGLEDGLNLVKARGEFIQKASEMNPGTMAAIIGLEREKLEEVCTAASTEGICEPVNFNCPGQIVIAGTSAGVLKAVELAQSAGAAKAVVLNVSGPFHSSLMAPAAEMMRAKLEGYTLADPVFPVVTNCDARRTTEAALLKDKLVRQINGPVKWEESVKDMIEYGASVFIEIGPQKVLSGLMRRIDRSKKSLNIEDMKSLEKALQELAAQ